MEKPNYFVPIDFSPASYKAVQYAMMLSQLSEGTLTLHHVIDGHEIVESDNPVVVNRCISRLSSAAKNKLDSICEMIRETGISVRYDYTFGKANLEIVRRSQTTQADFIVISKKQVSSIFGRNGAARLKLPIFIVPESATPNKPYNVLLATDLKPIQANGFTRFLNLIQKTCNELMLLYVTKRKAYNGFEKEVNQRLDEINQHIQINTTFSLHKNSDITSGILDFSVENNVDLLCTIKRKNGFVTKYLSKSISSELAYTGDLPMLVLNGCE